MLRTLSDAYKSLCCSYNYFRAMTYCAWYLSASCFPSKLCKSPEAHATDDSGCSSLHSIHKKCALDSMCGALLLKSCSTCTKADVYTISDPVVHVTRAGHIVVQCVKASQCAVGFIKVVITNHHAMACMMWHDLQLLTDFR